MEGERKFIHGVPACDLCGERPRSRFREVTGWEELRDQGGANKISARKETGRWCCEVCMLMLKTTVNPLQGSLL